MIVNPNVLATGSRLALKRLTRVIDLSDCTSYELFVFMKLVLFKSKRKAC